MMSVLRLQHIFLQLLWLICLIKWNECSMNCTNTSQCTCYTPFLDRYEFHCPPNSYAKSGYVIHVRDNERIRLDCYNLEEFKMNLLPIWQNLKIKHIEIRFSPLPQRNFKEIFEKFSDLKSIESFAFRFTISSNSTIQQRYFDGLEHLKMLDLSSNNFKYFDDDLFDKMTNLIYLDLVNNEIRLTSNLLRNLTNLRRLDLSSNKINEIPVGLFANLSELKSLNLWHNNLTKLNNHDFDRLINLLSLDLYANRIEQIDNDTFVNLINLKNLSLYTNNLKELPINLFANNLNLELLKLGNNPLNHLPEELFTNLTKLKILDLSNCNLNRISETLFKNFINLEELYLNNNQLEILTPLPSLEQLKIINLQNNFIEIVKNDLFKQLRNLQDIDLSRNQIKQIDIDSFSYNLKLIKINLSYNNYTLDIQDNNPFGICENLEELDLSFNQIKHVDSFLIATMLNLKKLNLRHNQIQRVSIDLFLTPSWEGVFMDLSNNQIETVSLDLNDLSEIKERIYTTINFRNNPFKCDCHMDAVWKYFQNQIDPSIKYSINIKEDDFICMEPLPYRNITIKKLKPYMLVCQLDELLLTNNSCPINCLCDWRSIDQTIIIDCTNQNLKQLPQLPTTYHQHFNFNEIEVHLENNNLIETPIIDIDGYENVTKLFLSENLIEKINWLPPNIEVLDLRNNSLNRLDDDILKKLEQIQNVSLDNNPWICDCSTTDFANFIRSNLDKINPVNIRCVNGGSRLLDLNKNDLCKAKIIVIYSCVAFLIFFLFLSLLIAFYYRYQQEIKVWLYARNWCLWWVTEDDLDKDKIYDAFISYSNLDEEFVMENLVPVLENGPNPYKLCLHKRNFIPGEFIIKQIINSVQDSKRTIVILSSNFLESVWGKMEFRTAHTQAMNDGCVRVIVILLDDIDLDKLDDEMKTYLKTNTYVKWGNPHFWDQLRYALPHHKNRLNHNDDRQKRQKHMKAMLKIDEKFNLTPTFTQNPESTPPVTSLDVSLLKKHPLNLMNNTTEQTTPAEC